MHRNPRPTKKETKEMRYEFSTASVACVKKRRSENVVIIIIISGRFCFANRKLQIVRTSSPLLWFIIIREQCFYFRCVRKQLRLLKTKCEQTETIQQAKNDYANMTMMVTTTNAEQTFNWLFDLPRRKVGEILWNNQRPKKWKEQGKWNGRKTEATVHMSTRI